MKSIFDLRLIAENGHFPNGNHGYCPFIPLISHESGYCRGICCVAFHPTDEKNEFGVCALVEFRGRND